MRRPSLPLERYAGRYRDPWYGDVTVGERGGRLWIDFTRTPVFKGPLEPWGADTFRTRWAAHNVRLHSTGAKHFRHPVVGELHLTYESMEMPGEPGLTLLVFWVRGVYAQPRGARWVDQMGKITGGALVSVGVFTLGLLAFKIAGNKAAAVLGTALAIKMIAYVGVAPVVGGFANFLPRRAFLVSMDIVRAAEASLTIACGSNVWTEAVIGVSALTRVAVTTMSSVLRMASPATAAKAGEPRSSSAAALPSSAVQIVMSSLFPLPGGAAAVSRSG